MFHGPVRFHGMKANYRLANCYRTEVFDMGCLQTLHVDVKRQRAATKDCVGCIVNKK